MRRDVVGTLRRYEGHDIKPVLDALLGPTHFPFEWELYTPYTELPPLPKLKEPEMR